MGLQVAAWFKKAHESEEQNHLLWYIVTSWDHYQAHVSQWHPDINNSHTTQRYMWKVYSINIWTPLMSDRTGESEPDLTSETERYWASLHKTVWAGHV